MEQKASHSVAHFAAKFCDALEKNKTTICSPLSAETILALLALASKNQTREELLQALGLPNVKAIRSTFKYLTSTIKSVKGVTLSIASKVYLRKEDNLKPKIMKEAENVFCPRSWFSKRNNRTFLEMLDFNDGNAAADVVNEWVSKQTNGLIKDVVSGETFTADTRVLLLNAIYFKGNWKTPFIKDLADRDFYVDTETTIKVPAMYMTDERFYGKSAGLKSKILQLPYKGGEASLVIVRPDDVEGLNSVLQQLAAGYDLMGDIKAMKETKVNITLPKFKAEMSIYLKDMLPKLGVKSIFDRGTSDIDMLTSNRRLFVSKAIQAYIEVDRSGATAVACMSPVKHGVKKHVETSGPSVYARSPLPSDRLATVNDEFRVTQQPGVCGPSTSPWASPLHVVPEKDGQIRPGCVYRRLNVPIEPDLCPVYRPQDFTYPKGMWVELGPKPRKFNVNRPFLYLLMCHKIPIFIGVYEGNEYAPTRK